MNPWTIWFKPAEADTWQPLELYRSLPTGHYRVAARLPRPFKHLNWRWKFYPQLGDIQYYDFQGKSNEEGLISLLDIDTSQPGTWQLIGRPDVLDELGGENWQLAHQFQIIASLTSALIIPPLLPSPAANEIVPHPPAEIPAMAEETAMDFTPSAETALSAIAPTNSPIPKPVIPEPTETYFSVLAEPDFVPEEEMVAESNHFRPVNYVLKLIDPEKATTYQVDFTVMLDDRRQPVSLDLPNPRQMVRLLHRPIPKPKSPLPPKLSKV
ncbi:MAG: hypothetical protein ACK58N_15230 [Synechocystis sp.]